MDVDYSLLRQQMVEEDIKRRGINDPLILSSFLTVPRHMFVPPYLQKYAYEDTPLPIGEGQTISQPFIVALMTAIARVDSTSRVLEIGTGSGYGAAILSRIAAEVYTVERISALATSAINRFQELGYSNIFVKIDDGTLGWPEKSPFNAIIVTAGAPHVPTTLLEQLAINGRLVIPIGTQFLQELCCYTKTADNDYKREVIEAVRFVPLIGKEGWHVQIDNS